MIDLRVGRWQEVLADVGEVDAVICDPPYGARTHAGNDGMHERFGDAARRDLSYASMSADDVRAFVAHWSPRCKGWMVAMTSHDLIGVWESAYLAAGRLAFAPVVVIQDRVRLGGDGPASCAIYLMTARPRRKAFLSWGALPGWYRAGTDREGHIGGKPLDLMRKIVSDYTRPGDLVADPTAGGATTLIAAHTLGRRAIGAEMDPQTAAKAQARIDRHLRQGTLFEPAAMATQPWLEV